MIWQAIPAVSFKELKYARLQLHHAVQIPAMISRSFLGKHPEDIYANLGWNHEYHALLSHNIPFKNRYLQLGIILHELKLMVLDGDLSYFFELSGNTWEQVISWLFDLLNEKGLETEKVTFAQPYAEDLPDFPTVNGSNFSLINPNAFSALSSFFANTDLVLESVLQGVGKASKVRCWPHHFDIASLIQFDKNRSVGIGLSPGDENYDEPYYYVNLWPYPDISKTSLPMLKCGGTWHTKGWVGAVLKASDFVGAKDQKENILSFLKDAMAQSRKLLAD